MIIKKLSNKGFLSRLIVGLTLGLSTFFALALVGVKVKFAKIPAAADTTLKVAQFSVQSGFYAKNIELIISTEIQNASIHYTLDGSVPTEESAKYKKPILIENRENKPNILSEIPTSPVWLRPLNTVFKGTVVRAIVVVADKKSEERTATYFVSHQGRNRYSIPVVNLTINSEDFFDYRKGIYVMGATRDDKDYYIRKAIKADNFRWHRYPANYLRKGSDWERTGKLEFLGGDGSGVDLDSVGFRIHGNATRANSQKSLRVYFKNRQRGVHLGKAILGRDQPYVLTNILIKGFGQDQTRALFRDNLIQAVIKTSDFKLNKQMFQPVILFLNGEYWGIHSMQERVDAETLAVKHQLPADSLTLLENDGTITFGKKEEGSNYSQLKKFMESADLSNKTNYTYVASRVDLDNLIDYLIVQMYAANTDWPTTNYHLWRCNGVPAGNVTEAVDGKWRWLLVDLDYGFGGKGTYSTNMVNHILGSTTIGGLFRSLMANAEFRQHFISRFEYHLNTTFETSRVLDIINQMATDFQPEIAEHISRWRTIASVKAWEAEVDALRQFAKERPAHQRKELEWLKREFNVLPTQINSHN